METAEGQEIVGIVWCMIVFVGCVFAIHAAFKYKDPSVENHRQWMEEYLKEKLKPIPPPSDVTRIRYWDGKQIEVPGKCTRTIELLVNSKIPHFAYEGKDGKDHLISLEGYRECTYYPPIKTEA